MFVAQANPCCTNCYTLSCYIFFENVNEMHASKYGRVLGNATLQCSMLFMSEPPLLCKLSVILIFIFLSMSFSSVFYTNQSSFIYQLLMILPQ